ncbi:nickel ABC transporter permease [Paenibacillus tepidiphilus]|uniref:nickel ABC transporter permease n=1 Tax=Paenibacillus tepidiphilus TaxID=2608683 RepID=UPI001238B599|nr:nickel ABC transporter permease [Paenibacillus tepidiphilus]
MWRSFGKKLLGLLVFVLFLSFISFCLLKLVPGDPVRSMLRVDDVAVSREDIADLRNELGLDRPLLVQYGAWLGKLLRLDFGVSYMTYRPVLGEFAEKLPFTLLLTGGSLLVMLVISVPLGALSAVYRNRWVDRFSRVFSLIGSSLPSFWLGLLLIQLLSVKLHLLPPMGGGSLAHLVLPSLTLGVAMSAIYVRLIRSSLLESGGQDFVASAKARGLHPARVFWFHTFRHSLVPLVTLLSESLGSLLGGTLVVEILFAYPGLGKWIVDAIVARDYPVIQGYILFISLCIVVLNLLVELSYRWIHPQLGWKGR